MTSTTDRFTQLRGDATDALTQLVSTASSGSRKAQAQARKRLTAAVLALRGKQPTRARWLVAGAVAGLLAGIAATVGLRRQLDSAADGDDAEHSLTAATRDKAQRTAVQAREAAAKVRDKLGRSNGSDGSDGVNGTAEPAEHAHR